MLPSRPHQRSLLLPGALKAATTGHPVTNWCPQTPPFSPGLGSPCRAPPCCAAPRWLHDRERIPPAAPATSQPPLPIGPISAPLHYLSAKSLHRFQGSLTHSQTPLIKWATTLAALQLPLPALSRGLCFHSDCSAGLRLPIIPLAPNTNPKTSDSDPLVTAFHLYEISFWARAKKLNLFWSLNLN